MCVGFSCVEMINNNEHDPRMICLGFLVVLFFRLTIHTSCTCSLANLLGGIYVHELSVAVLAMGLGLQTVFDLDPDQLRLWYDSVVTR